MVLMQDYSSEAFKMAMSSHFYRYGAPAVLTADNGSQIRKAAGNGEATETGNISGSLTRLVSWGERLVERHTGLPCPDRSPT